MVKTCEMFIIQHHQFWGSFVSPNVRGRYGSTSSVATIIAVVASTMMRKSTGRMLMIMRMRIRRTRMNSRLCNSNRCPKFTALRHLDQFCLRAPWWDRTGLSTDSIVKCLAENSGELAAIVQVTAGSSCSAKNRSMMFWAFFRLACLGSKSQAHTLWEVKQTASSMIHFFGLDGTMDFRSHLITSPCQKNDARKRKDLIRYPKNCHLMMLNTTE